ncbi:MAG TPA: tryptophan--tRNA ligase [Mycobacteriales bacterium]|nr:tryptophan--tRNA ligase [Mycobacteriales bacterium]
MPANRPRVLSGMQPTADSLQLGNYLGALRQWVDMQENHEVFYFVADMHSLTVEPDPAVLRHRTRVTAAQFLAAGVDPQRSALFVQSQVPEHAQLAWVLGCLTGYGEANRMTQFKDKAGRSGGGNVGLFTYPVLQAADILLYQADFVPVGEDQRQHLELTRDLAQRFNSRYGETFVVPEPYIPKQTAKIYDLQTVDKQMSKSIGGAGCIWLLDDPKVIEKRIRSAVTDTGREVTFDPESKPGVSNLLTILSAFSGDSIRTLEERFAGRGYGDLKKDVAAALLDWVVPFQARIKHWLDDAGAIDEVLTNGAATAAEVASRTLAATYEAVGFLPARS